MTLRSLLLGLGFLCTASAGAAPMDCPAGPTPLAAALARARQSNPDVLAARGQASAAAAAVTIAGERPNPTLNLLANQYDPRRSANVGGVSHTPVFASAQVTEQFERGGKRRARIEAAGASREAAEADLADALRHGEAAVRAAYYDLKFAEAKREALQDVRALQEQTLDAADRRVKAGDISPTDRARIAVETLKARNDELSAEAEATSARITLAGLMGCAGSAPLLAADDWPAPVAETPGAPSARADEIAAEARTRAAEGALAVARAEQHRDVTLGLEYDHDPRVAPHMAGISVSVPLFLAHHYEGEVAQALAQRDAAMQSATSTHVVADAEREGSQSLLLAATQRRRRSVEDVLPQAEQAAEAVEYAYAHGATPLLDLLDARRTLRAARLDALAAENDYAHALAARDAAHGLLTYAAIPIASSTDGLAPQE